MGRTRERCHARKFRQAPWKAIRTVTALNDGRAETEEEDHWLHFGLVDDEITEYTALREDIPEWLATSLWNWIRDSFLISERTLDDARRGVTPSPRVDRPLVRKCERVLRVQIFWGCAGSTSRDAEFQQSIRYAYSKCSNRDVWRLVNYLLAEGHARGGTLKTYLLDAGSEWTVAAAKKGKCYLVRRVPDGVEVAAAAAFQHPNGGKRLAKAWEAIFGVNPNPSEGYRLAVKAVEDASAPVVIPDDPTPTLGKVISRIDQGGQFRLPHLREEPGGTTSHDVMLNNLKQLWWGQYDRHGGQPESPLPDDVTQDEAETAVMLAVALVGWFETGKVQP